MTSSIRKSLKKHKQITLNITEKSKKNSPNPLVLQVKPKMQNIAFATHRDSAQTSPRGFARQVRGRLPTGSGRSLVRGSEFLPPLLGCLEAPKLPLGRALEAKKAFLSHVNWKIWSCKPSLHEIWRKIAFQLDFFMIFLYSEPRFLQYLTWFFNVFLNSRKLLPRCFLHPFKL